MSLGLPRPINESPDSARMAYKTDPIQPETTSEVMLGRISKAMMRQVGSPLTRAASTNSLFRSTRVCERSTRAPQAQLRRLKTRMTVSGPGRSIIPAITIMIGSCGKTRTTLVIIDRKSSTVPPTKPAVRPTAMPMTVMTVPITKPTRRVV